VPPLPRTTAPTIPSANSFQHPAHYRRNTSLGFRFVDGTAGVYSGMAQHLFERLDDVP
jgi:hypothetical protein